MKTYGANIRCSACGAEPWPDDPATRESFNLRRFGPDGRPAESPTEGEWRCEQHLPQQQPVTSKPRPAGRAPVEALTEFESVLATETARLDEAIAEHDGAGGALEAFRQEIERSLASLRKAAAA